MKKVFKILGWVILVVCFVFIIRAFMNFDIDFSIFLDIKLLLIIVGLAIVHSSAVFINSFSWYRILKNISHLKIAFLDVYNVYAKSNIGKYLPGNVMHFAGRNIIGAKYSMSQKDMTISTAMEVALKLFCAYVIIMIMGSRSFSYTIQTLEENNISIELFWIVIILVAVALIGLLIYYFIPKKNKVVSFISNLKTLLLVNTSYSIIFIVNILVFLVIINYMSPNAYDIPTLMYISSIYLISWFIGYLTPGAPGGIGVRETILILLLTSVTGGEVIAVASILVRIVNILSDILGFITNKIVSKYFETKNVVE